MFFFSRSYPSLNLRIEVHKDQHKAIAILPGLRYDDITYTGMYQLHFYWLVTKLFHTLLVNRLSKQTKY